MKAQHRPHAASISITEAFLIHQLISAHRLMGSDEPSLHLLAHELPLHVSLKEPELVVPSDPPPPEEGGSGLFLSNIDRALIYTVETVHFFAPTLQKPSCNVARTLKEGLSKLLCGPYHFMAGRLRVDPATGRLDIHCNGKGALFAEAAADHTIDELGDVSHPSPQFKKLVLQAFDVKSLEELPLLLIQVTLFKCGGFVIGLGTNHTLVDGFAAVDFMHNYAAIVRGELSLIIEPQTDRTPLKARSPPRISYPHSELIRLQDLPREVVSSFTDPSFGSNGGDVSGHMLPTDSHIFRSFHFSKFELDDLKRTAMQGGDIKKCSSFDVITAHVWQARAKAIGLQPNDTSTLFFAVDLRGRMEPPLHPHFCGNGVYSAHATASARELEERPLSFCVKKVQEAIAAVTDDYVRSALDWSEVHQGVPAVLGGCFFVAAWWKLDFQSVDFGWGKPIYCGPVVNGRVEFVLLLPHTSKDSCRVYLALESHQMDLFEQLIRRGPPKKKYPL